MIDVQNLKKIIDVLNAEGTILALHEDPDNNLYLSSFLKDGSGTIYYSITEKQLKHYLHSKLTLNELYQQSPSFLVKYIFQKEVKTFLKQDFLNSLQCGNDYYKNLPKSMRSIEIESKLEN